MSAMEGFEEVERQLMALGDAKVIKKLAKAGLTAGQRVVVKAIKAKIPAKYKDARRTVGQSVKRMKYSETPTQFAAKVGFAVGKKMPSREAAAATRAQRRVTGKKGVGVSARNVHWLVLGTKSTSSAPLHGVVQAGVSSSSAEAANKIKTNIAEGIRRTMSFPT